MLPPHEHNPFVDPGWRHLRAIHLVAHSGRANHPRDDDMSRNVWRFYRALRRCTNENRRKTLARKMPAHFEAHALFAAAGHYQKAELEARFLAGQDDDAIATRCGLSPAAVGVYHDSYFAVRSRLAWEGYIFHVVAGSRLHGGLTDKDHDLILTLVAYQLGPVALDALLAHFAQPALVLNELKRLDSNALLALGDHLRCQALMHVLTMRSDRRSLRTAVLLQDLLGRLRAAEENRTQQAPTLRLMDESVYQRLQTVGTRHTEETLMGLGKKVGLQSASAVADARDATLTLRAAADISAGVYLRDLHSGQPSSTVKSGPPARPEQTMAMAG